MNKFIFVATVLIVFILGFRPIGAYDTLYTAKVGKMILENRTLPKTETLSWSAAGRPWLIHQPIAEMVLGAIDMAGGLPALSWLASAMLSIFFILTYVFLVRVCRSSKTIALGLSFFTASATTEFFIPRAQLFAQVFFSAFLLILYLKLYSNKDFLILLLPLSYLWANSHASFILGPYLLAATALTSWWYWRAVGKKQKATQALRTFSLWTFLTLAVSILPPVRLQGWEVLIRFGRDLTFLRAYITEWAPLSSDFTHFSFYLGVVTTSFVLAGMIWWRHRNHKPYILLLPLLPIIALAFPSLRNVPFGIIATIYALGFFLSLVRFRPVPVVLITLFLLPLSLWLFINKREVARESAWFFPWKAASFLKTNRLSGRMFNEMALGSFLLYTLSPQYQIFFDGRVEMFGCCEMRDFYRLMQYKTASRETFRAAWDAFDQKYQFSYALIPISSYNPLVQNTVDRIGDLLLDDPQWILVYFDDSMRVFVRKDGRNDTIISQFGMDAITPLRFRQFRQGKEQEAKRELLRMISVDDSAIARTILGTIEMGEGEIAPAKADFEKAADQNPYYGLPLVGLAQIAQEQQRSDDARRLLATALTRSPYLGQAYLMLADSFLTNGQRRKAAEILQKGLKYNIDFISRRDILQKLESLR